MNNLTTFLKIYIRALVEADFPNNSICSHFGVLVSHILTILSYTTATPSKGNVLISESKLDLFEENSPFRHLSIAITDHQGELLITLYSGMHSGIKYTSLDFSRLVACVSQIGSIRQSWNGKAGDGGISIVMKIPTPPKFKKAIQNYYDLGERVFKLTDEDELNFKVFDDTFSLTLKEVSRYV